VWIKRRDGSGQDHVIQDVVRGFTTTTKLSSSSAAQENAGTDSATDPKWGYVSGTGATSFTVDASTSGDQANKNTWSYAAWAWDAGSSTVTNTAGSISSQVRANASAGFSVVTFTANGVSGATVGHGLGVSPSLIIVKGRTNARAWLVYHASTGNTHFLQLNTTIASTSGASAWNNTSPTSTVFTLGNSLAGNESGATCVAYCFAPVAGYSSFGIYTGNGSTDGPFVYTGFRPRWVMFKSSSSSVDWVIEDAARGAFNVIDARLFPNTTDSELSNGNGNVDYLANGFKLRNAHLAMNANSGTYIYAAFAEHPFQYARAR
jgi:hypothetical protein